MSPKRKIPSRKLPSRKFASTKASGAKSTQSSRVTPHHIQRPPAPKPRPKSKSHPAKSPSSQLPAASPSVPECFWDMGFEELPTVEELRQRYKELSLVLHPDAGGNKQSFVALRTNYETALALLEKS